MINKNLETLENCEITLQLKNIMDKGAFADIFLINNGERVVKLFKSYLHPDIIKVGYTQDEYIDYRSKVCNSEILAYCKASSSVILNEYTPVFYGQKQICKVLNEVNEDVSHYYMLENNYSLEKVNGKSEKWIFWTSTSEFRDRFSLDITDVIQKFEDESIYAKDSDFIVNDKFFKVIDIALHDSNYYDKIHSYEQFQYSNCDWDKTFPK